MDTLQAQLRSEMDALQVQVRVTEQERDMALQARASFEADAANLQKDTAISKKIAQQQN